MSDEQGTQDGLAYQDGVLKLRDNRDLAWRWWGEVGALPVLRLQGMPGSRLFRYPDPAVQIELGIRYLRADRPGYGGSTRKPGHGIADLTADLVALLDFHGLERVPVIGGSGGGPLALALAACHPERVSAVSVVVGASPMTPAEAAGLIGLNAEAYAAKQTGWEPLFALLSRAREATLQAGFRSVMSDAPPSDLAIMERPEIEQRMRVGVAEALRQGAEGWADESFSLRGEWDFDPADIQTTVTWWHGDDDRNAPLSGARRAVARLPEAELRVWHHEGHMASVLHDREIMEELLDRARRK